MSGLRKYGLPILAISVLLIAGCQKPGPIELEDPRQSGVDSVEPLLPSAVPDGTDSTGLLVSDQTSYSGHVVVTGVRYDLPAESHTVSLAGVVLLDKTQPILQNGVPVGFRAMDVGNVLVDGLPLYRVPHHVRYLAGSVVVDTIAGVQYGVVNRDGIGGRGFTYAPGHMYRWTNAWSGPVLLDLQTMSAKEVVVSKPVAGDVILQGHDMFVEWTGGEQWLYLIISGAEAGRGVTPLLRMKIWSNIHRVAIPTKILRLLPNSRYTWFVLTFVSERRGTSQVQGFPDTVLVYSASIHNVFVRVRP